MYNPMFRLKENSNYLKSKNPGRVSVSETTNVTVSTTFRKFRPEIKNTVTEQGVIDESGDALAFE